MAYTIKDNITTVNRNVGRYGNSVKWIVVHNTANADSSEGIAYNNTKYFKSVYREASAHYFIDDGDVVWRCVYDKDTAWAVGDGSSGPAGKKGACNYNSISIEVCEPKGGVFTQHEKEVLRWLVLKLMDTYGIRADHVIRHNDVSLKTCPSYYTKNAAAWKELHSYIATKTASSAPEKKQTTPTTTKKQELNIDGWWGKATTKKLQQVLGVTVDGYIKGQDSSDFKKVNAGGLQTDTWKTGSGGSATVKAMQKKLGVTADGYFGPNTCKALQKRMGTTVDGKISGPSLCVKALQKKLNSGKF